ncbi:MAG TPA: monofunctional biosynthetic peptidoglycan transglycosylase [Candidatus Binatia bacterium]
MIGFILKSTPLLVLFLAAVSFFEYRRLPDVSALRTTNPQITSLMRLRAGQFREKGHPVVRHQIWVPYRTISAHLKWAVIVNEDASFFQHGGIDLFELKEALRDDLLEAGRFKRGASTITMQLARNLYLSPRKSIVRKIRETLIALQMERVLSKHRIFEIYLNVVEWGSGIYGAEAASRHYFDKRVSTLTVSEAATLAALLPDPSSPDPSALRARKDRILRRLRAQGHISPSEFNRAVHPPPLHRRDGLRGMSPSRPEERIAG